MTWKEGRGHRFKRIFCHGVWNGACKKNKGSFFIMNLIYLWPIYSMTQWKKLFLWN